MVRWAEILIFRPNGFSKAAAFPALLAQQNAISGTGLSGT
jgi:hypothetical protein